MQEIRQKAIEEVLNSWPCAIKSLEKKGLPSGYFKEIAFFNMSTLSLLLKEHVLLLKIIKSNGSNLGEEDYSICFNKLFSVGDKNLNALLLILDNDNFTRIETFIKAGVTFSDICDLGSVRSDFLSIALKKQESVKKLLDKNISLRDITRIAFAEGSLLGDTFDDAVIDQLFKLLHIGFVIEDIEKIQLHSLKDSLFKQGDQHINFIERIKGTLKEAIGCPGGMRDDSALTIFKDIIDHQACVETYLKNKSVLMKNLMEMLKSGLYVFEYKEILPILFKKGLSVDNITRLLAIDLREKDTVRKLLAEHSVTNCLPIKRLLNRGISLEKIDQLGEEARELLRKNPENIDIDWVVSHSFPEVYKKGAIRGFFSYANLPDIICDMIASYLTTSDVFSITRASKSAYTAAKDLKNPSIKSIQQKEKAEKEQLLSMSLSL